MPIWHQSPKLTPRYFLETPRLFGYPFLVHATETLLYSIIEKELLSIALKYYIGQHVYISSFH